MTFRPRRCRHPNPGNELLARLLSLLAAHERPGCRRNELPAKRNGRDIILFREDLDAWMESWETVRPPQRGPSGIYVVTLARNSVAATAIAQVREVWLPTRI